MYKLNYQDRIVKNILETQKRILEHSHITDPDVAYEIARQWVCG